MINWVDVWTVAWHEYRTNVRRRGFILGTLLPPALGLLGIIISLVVIFFAGRSVGEVFEAARPAGPETTSETTKAGLINQSQHFTPPGSESGGGYALLAGEEAARQALAADEISHYILIPADYVDTGTVTIYGRDEGEDVDYAGLRLLLITGLLAGKVDEAAIARVEDPLHLKYVDLNAGGEPRPAGGSPLEVLAATPLSELIDDPPLELLSRTAGIINSIFFMGLLLMLIFASGNYLFRSVSEEKESRIIEIVLSSVSAGELLAGKIVGFTALTLTQVAVWLLSLFVLSGGIAAAIVGATIVLNPASFFLGAAYCLLGYLMYAIIMGTLGAGTTNLREGQPLLAIFLLTPMMSAYPGCFLFAIPEASNSLFVRLLSFFPLTGPMIMTIRLAVGNVPLVDIAGSILVLLATNALILWAGVKIFRASLLMYGKRLTVRQIVRIMKEA